MFIALNTWQCCRFKEKTLQFWSLCCKAHSLLATWQEKREREKEGEKERESEKERMVWFRQWEKKESVWESSNLISIHLILITKKCSPSKLQYWWFAPTCEFKLQKLLKVVRQSWMFWNKLARFRRQNRSRTNGFQHFFEKWKSLSKKGVPLDQVLINALSK